jgi:hypothetical protein
MKINLKRFGGIAPAVDAEELPDIGAQTAENCAVRTGKLTPLRANVVENELGAVGHKGLYRWTYVLHSLTCGAAGSSTVAEWVAISSPGFTITIDDAEFEVEPDFSAAADMDDVATALQTAIRAQTEGIERVLWSTDHFVIHTDAAVEVLTSLTGKTDISGTSWLNGAAGTVAATETESWLSWAADADVVRSGVAGDRFNRIYVMGDSMVPQVKGTAAGQLRSYDLKIPAPDRVPILETVPQFEFSQFRAYVEVASTGALKVALVSTTDFTREGAEYSFTLPLASALYECGVEYRIVIQGYVSNAATPFWVTCEEVKSFMPHFAYNWSPRTWKESFWNSVHEDGDGEVTALVDEDAQAVGVLDLTLDLAVTGSSNFESQAVVSWTVSGRAVCKVTPKGTFPACPDEASQRMCYAYVTEWGEEGPASEASAEVTRHFAENVRVWMPTTVTDLVSRGIITLRVYQTDGAGDWRFCGDTPLDDTAVTATLNAALDGTDSEDDGVLSWEGYVAKTPIASLGEVLLDGAVPPDDELQGLVEMPGGFFAAFQGREVWFSLPYRPEAWPVAFQMMVHDEIVTISPSGNELFVLTGRTHYLLTGSEPQYMTQSRIMHDDACVGKRGTTPVGDLVVAPGPDGLSAFAGGQARVATELWYNQETWAAVRASELVARAHDGVYSGFSTAGGLLIDPREATGAVRTTDDEDITALWRDDAADALYALDGDGDVVEFNASSGAYRELTWKSKRFVFGSPVKWVAVRVRAASYTGTVTLNLYGDGTLRGTVVLASGVAVRAPWMLPCRKWELEVVASTPIYEVGVATSMKELRR